MAESPQIDLLCLDGARARWSLGAVISGSRDVSALSQIVADWIQSSRGDAIFFWDPCLGDPPEDAVRSGHLEPVDILHCGLKLGAAGEPELMELVNPAWMFSRDSSPELASTCWRISLRACLIRREVLVKFQFLDPQFRSLEVAALEWGYQLILAGVLIRHLPGLVASTQPAPKHPLNSSDQALFLAKCYGKGWAKWGMVRGLISGRFGLSELVSFRAAAADSARRRAFEAYRRSEPFIVQGRAWARGTVPQDYRVSVLIPTIGRYPYLRVLLSQLRTQTIPPLEIIVVDQTGMDSRDMGIASEFQDLPLRILYRDNPGQCSSRNAGILNSTGDFILLLDDDVEIPPWLIEAHLWSLETRRAGVSSGVAEEVGAGPVPESQRCVRASDVFPAGNTMVRRSVLERVGLFDLAYEKGARADGDLGMRIYLAGELMILDGGIEVLHHHAPAGGLRQHKARKVTYASSRTHLMHRHIPSITEIYLAFRHYNPSQVREMLWLRILGTFSIRGGALRKALKVVISLLALPHSLWVLRRNVRAAHTMMKTFPQVASLSGRTSSARAALAKQVGD